jgi:hypothetical protein
MAAPRRKRRPSKASVAASWRSFWETPEGRNAINALMAQFGVYSQINAVDGVGLAIQVGERNVAAWIAQQCGVQPEQYVQERTDTDRIFTQQFAFQ